MRVRLLKGAEVELEEAESRYEGIAEDLGVKFYFQVKATLAEISRSPMRFAVHRHNFRRALVKDFPFVVIYEPRSQEVVIVSIMHTSRRPGYWRSRVTKK